MDTTTQILSMPADQNRKIADTINKERGKLLNFIRKRVSNEADAEDILQDVFYQLVESYRLMKPIEQVSAWMFTVARNKITDMFRKKKAIPFTDREVRQDNEDEPLFLQDLLLSTESGPEDDMIRGIVMNALEEALQQIPEDQRNVFIWHEIEGKSFKELSEELGLPVNTLISRKRYAVLALREHLGNIYEEFITE